MAHSLPSLPDILRDNDYPGRGIAVGLSPDGRRAILFYFIMGRSENSRNRVFREEEGGRLSIYPFDESRVADPTLIIYSPARTIGSDIILTNGDQTDTVADGLSRGIPFAKSLESRRFEPDAPHFTPRISAIAHLAPPFSYEMSLLRCEDERGEACCRFTYAYEPLPGVGHFLHTYRGSGDLLPSFTGEPIAISLPDDLAALARDVWASLHPENKISLYARAVDLSTGESESRLYNRREEEQA